jgi:uncharacterized protein
LDLADLEDGTFFETAMVRPTKQGRFMAIGPFADGVISVVFAPLGSAGSSVISMRWASKKERRLLL